METKIRSETGCDIAAVRAINLAAFDTPTEADLADRLRETPNFIPELSLVAESDDGDILGHALFSLVDVVDGDDVTPVLSLAPIAVQPDYQGRGIGSQLMREGIARAPKHGYGMIVLIGHPTYYPRFGFVPAGQHGLECPWPVSDEVFMVHETIPGTLGRVRGRIVYPAPFDYV